MPDIRRNELEFGALRILGLIFVGRRESAELVFEEVRMQASRSALKIWIYSLSVTF